MDRTLLIVGLFLLALIIILVNMERNKELVVLSERSNAGAAAYSNGTSCFEPKPSLRFICANGMVVADIAGCAKNGTCAQVIGRHFVCTDGSTATDPSKCPASAPSVYGSVRTIFECSDGREAASEADCSANCSASATSPSNAGQGPSGAGKGNASIGLAGFLYECWDGSISRSPSSCRAYCNSSCSCAPAETPVCAAGKTYLNPCIALCSGASNYSAGPCAPPVCAKANDSCTQVASIGTTRSYLSDYSYPTCCEPGSTCNESGICASIAPQCGMEGASCSASSATGGQERQGNCCPGFACENGACVSANASAQCGKEYSSCQSDSDCCTGLGCAPDKTCRTPPGQQGPQAP